ncbi:hypothetical protein EBU94_07115 [bacterium]|nr:hypothetical protein [bacterium]
MEDINIFGEIIQKDDIITVENDYYTLESGGMAIKLSLDQIKSDKRFQIMESHKFDVKELEEDWDVVKTWRMQLDITTSKRKLIQIQSMFQETLDKFSV